MAAHTIVGNTNGTIVLSPINIVSVGTVDERVEHGTTYYTYGIELSSSRVVHPRFATSGAASSSRTAVINLLT